MADLTPASPLAAGGIAGDALHHGTSTKTVTQGDGLILVSPCLPREKHQWYGDTHTLESRGFIASATESDTVITLPSSADPHLTPQSAATQAASSQTPSSVLASVCASGDVDAVLSLLKLDSSRSNSSVNVLADTPARGQSEAMISVNRPVNSAGFLPLHLASSRGHIEVVVILVDRAGAVVDMPDTQNETALLKAAYNGHSDILSFLLDRNADPNHKDKDGWTALHNCSSRGHYAAAAVLIEGGADVNAQSKTGFTPLMNAASKGFVDITELLLQSYADSLIKNAFGDSAYDLAAQSEEAYICDILITAEHQKRLSSKQNLGSNPTPSGHSSVLEMIHENQRSALFSTSRFSPENLTRHDSRGPWTRAGTTIETRLQDVSLPRDWFWLTEWRVDLKHPRVDPVSGWQYARDFGDADTVWTASPVGSAIVGGFVRRRRWIRVRRRRVDAVEALGPNVDQLTLATGESRAATPSVDVGRAQEADYIVRAELTLENLKSAVSRASTPLISLKEDLRRYEEAIQILLSGIKSDTDGQRKKEASNIVVGHLTHAESISEKINELQGTAGGSGFGSSSDLILEFRAAEGDGIEPHFNGSKRSNYINYTTKT
ncbi:hypothetical protein HDU67_005975 [Dinochytrium kinnereticum]|nr:hypothetical protein HDU67_005975 [Dinochytrium kinnereticum]